VKGFRAIQRGEASTRSPPARRTADANPQISLRLLAPLIAQGVVIAGAGIVLFLAPTTGHDIWGWELTPFNTRFLGAIYLAALPDFVALALVRRWRPARLVVPMDFLFMSVILVVSLAYADHFKWERPVTSAWFAIFVSVPLCAGILLVRLRRFWELEPGGSAAPSARVRAGLIAAAVPLGGYGIGLLVAPGAVTGFWPWSIDGFHGRVYSAIFLTLALASVLVARAAAPVELATLGLTCVALGALEPLGLLVVDADLDKVDWSSGGTVAWIAMFAAILGYGIALGAAAPSVRRQDAELHVAQA
jgi:hypothetical protein